MSLFGGRRRQDKQDGRTVDIESLTVSQTWAKVIYPPSAACSRFLPPVIPIFRFSVEEYPKMAFQSLKPMKKGEVVNIKITRTGSDITDYKILR